MRDQQAIDELKTRLTKEKAEELVKAGKRVGIIAREYGSHHKTVGAVLMEYGLTYEGVAKKQWQPKPAEKVDTPGEVIIPKDQETIMMQIRGVYAANSLADILDTLATTVTGIRLPSQKYVVVLDIRNAHDVEAEI